MKWIKCKLFLHILDEGENMIDDDMDAIEDGAILHGQRMKCDEARSRYTEIVHLWEKSVGIHTAIRKAEVVICVEYGFSLEETRDLWF
jgi:hypothetical protein